MLTRDEAVAPRSIPAVLKEKKLDSSLTTLAAGQPAAAGLKLQNGRVAVEIWLNDASDEVLARLKALGIQGIYGPGASTEDIVRDIRGAVERGKA